MILGQWNPEGLRSWQGDWQERVYHHRRSPVQSWHEVVQWYWHRGQNNDKGRLTQEEIDRMVEEAEYVCHLDIYFRAFSLISTLQEIRRRGQGDPRAHRGAQRAGELRLLAQEPGQRRRRPRRQDQRGRQGNAPRRRQGGPGLARGARGHGRNGGLWRAKGETV